MEDDGSIIVQVFDKEGRLVEEGKGPTLKERKDTHDRGECLSLCAFCFEEANSHTKKECPHFSAQYEDNDDTSEPVLEFCGHPENASPCEGNCLASLCPLGVLI